MNIPSRVKLPTFVAALSMSLMAMGSAQALDASGYEKLTSETVKELISGKISDPAVTLARLEKAMQIGIEGCKEYAAANPAEAVLINHVVASAPKMLKMKPEELEEAWGDEGNAGDSVGKPLKSIDQFSVTRNYLDLIVHPARAYDFVVQYKATGDKQNLEQAKGELIEVLEHVKKIKAKA